jgi:SAM-dependent methyltransferase
MMKNKSSKILHLGCGRNKKNGAIGIDIDPHSDADIVHDLNTFPYPFSNNYFTVVIAEHILEHLDDIVKVMEEVHRISKDSAYIHITSPHFSSVDGFTDITHRHYFTSRSFDYFIPGTDLYKYRYAHVKYIKNKIILGPKTNNKFLQLILNWINRHQLLYESRLAYIFPVGIIQIQLQVDKK